MKISDPHYGKLILEKHFEKIEYRDYDKINKKLKTAYVGIHLLFYDGYISGNINYKSDSVSFKLETEYVRYICIKISNEKLTMSHFEYFSDLIKKLQSNKKEIDDMCQKFKDDLPINYIRQEKINQIV